MEQFEAIVLAVRAYFADRSRSKEQIKEDLQALRDDIDAMIDSLD